MIGSELTDEGLADVLGVVRGSCLGVVLMRGSAPGFTSVIGSDRDFRVFLKSSGPFSSADWTWVPGIRVFYCVHISSNQWEILANHHKANFQISSSTSSNL